jgi:hypothetical protein
VNRSSPLDALAGWRCCISNLRQRIPLAPGPHLSKSALGYFAVNSATWCLSPISALSGLQLQLLSQVTPACVFKPGMSLPSTWLGPPNPSTPHH